MQRKVHIPRQLPALVLTMSLFAALAGTDAPNAVVVSRPGFREEVKAITGGAGADVV